MIIMVLGMMQFGLYLFGLSVVENASRNGARARTLAPHAHLPWRAVPGSAGVDRPVDMNQLGLLTQYG